MLEARLLIGVSCLTSLWSPPASDRAASLLASARALPPAVPARAPGAVVRGGAGGDAGGGLPRRGTGGRRIDRLAHGQDRADRRRAARVGRAAGGAAGGA